MVSLGMSVEPPSKPAGTSVAAATRNGGRSMAAAALRPKPGYEFDEALFRALHAMAIKSPRFQADVQAAMRSGDLTANPAQLAAALERLALAGRVSNLIPLADGGLLITVAV